MRRPYWLRVGGGVLHIWGRRSQGRDHQEELEPSQNFPAVLEVSSATNYVCTTQVLKPNYNVCLSAFPSL